MAVTVNGIYRNYEGTDAQCSGVQYKREITFATDIDTSGVLRYLDCNSGVHYFYPGAHTDVTDHGTLSGLLDDDHTQYIRTDAARGFTNPVSGVLPILTNDLATKGYVDSEVATLSGYMGDHTNLTNIGTNTHSQIDTHIASGEIHFTEGSIDHGNIAGLGDDDHTIYSLADGSRPFTGTVSGVTPTLDQHLATKGYVDTEISGIIIPPSGYFSATATELYPTNSTYDTIVLGDINQVPDASTDYGVFDKTYSLIHNYGGQEVKVGPVRIDFNGLDLTDFDTEVQYSQVIGNDGDFRMKVYNRQKTLTELGNITYNRTSGKWTALDETNGAYDLYQPSSSGLWQTDGTTLTPIGAETTVQLTDNVIVGALPTSGVRSVLSSSSLVIDSDGTPNNPISTINSAAFILSDDISEKFRADSSGVNIPTGSAFTVNSVDIASKWDKLGGKITYTSDFTTVASVEIVKDTDEYFEIINNTTPGSWTFKSHISGYGESSIIFPTEDIPDFLFSDPIDTYGRVYINGEGSDPLQQGYSNIEPLMISMVNQDDLDVIQIGMLPNSSYNYGIQLLASGPSISSSFLLPRPSNEYFEFSHGLKIPTGSEFTVNGTSIASKWTTSGSDIYRDSSLAVGNTTPLTQSNDFIGIRIGQGGHIMASTSYNNIFYASNLYYNSGWKSMAAGYGSFIGFDSIGSVTIRNSTNTATGAGQAMTLPSIDTFSFQKDGAFKINGSVYLKERAAALTGDATSGQIWAKTDGLLHYQANATTDYLLSAWEPVTGGISYNSGYVNIAGTVDGINISNASANVPNLAFLDASSQKATVEYRGATAPAIQDTMRIGTLSGSSADLILLTDGSDSTTIGSDGSVTMPAVYADTLGATNKPLGIDSTGKLAPIGTGATGTFTTVDSKTVTVTNGIITSIV